MRKARLLLGPLIFLLLGAADLRDPTQPPGATSSLITSEDQPVTNLVLGATYIYPHKSYALINGSLFKVGDQLGQFTIIAITPYSVELKGPQNTKETLQLVAQLKKMRTP